MSALDPLAGVLLGKTSVDSLYGHQRGGFEPGHCATVLAIPIRPAAGLRRRRMIKNLVLVWWLKSSLSGCGRSAKRSFEEKPHQNHKVLVSFRTRNSLERTAHDDANSRIRDSRSMIRKNGYRLSEKIMLKQKDRAG
jgi:hypothetical protein